MLYKLIILLWILAASPVWGACSGSSPTWTSTPDRTSVNTCVTNATAGDTINVSAGSETWTSEITITKGLNLIGAGIGSTIITNSGSAGSYIITYNPSNYELNTPFRLSGFTFNANGKRSIGLGATKNAPFTLQTGVRIDSNKFINGGSDLKGQSIWNYGSLYGVVYNNIFDGVNYPIANSYGVGGDSWWANSPQNVFSHGSSEYLYYEDNQFINMAGYSGGGDNIIMDGEYASRYIFRYNTIINTVPSYSLLEMHGQQGEGPTSMPASFGVELYGNQIDHGSNTMTFWKQRSGQSLVFLNNSTTTASPSNNAYTGGIDTCPVDYTTLKVTHNSYWWGSRKNLTGALWSASATGGLNCNGLIDIPTLGRDIYSDGSSPGVSSGTLASIPGTCTVGQGYWATTQSTSNLTDMVGINPTTPITGTLYKCTSTDTWSSYYTPYTYPHPLRGVTSSPPGPSKLNRRNDGFNGGFQ